MARLTQAKQRDFFSFDFSFGIFVHGSQFAVCTEAQQLPVPWLTPDFNLCSVCLFGVHTIDTVSFCWITWFFSLMKKCSLYHLRKMIHREFSYFLMVQLINTRHHKWRLYLCRSVVPKQIHIRNRRPQLRIQQVWSKALERKVLRSSEVMKMFVGDTLGTMDVDNSY